MQGDPDHIFYVDPGHLRLVVEVKTKYVLPLMTSSRCTMKILVATGQITSHQCPQSINYNIYLGIFAETAFNMVWKQLFYIILVSYLFHILFLRFHQRLHHPSITFYYIL